MIERPRLISVEPNDDYALLLTYANGEKRIYDFSENLEYPFFAQLKNIELFKAVKVKEHHIEWPTGQDFCPGTLYKNSVPATVTH